MVSAKEISKHNGKYDTPTKLGVKWQMDVKYVPKVCYVGTDGEKFYQYTAIEEASRKRFIRFYFFDDLQKQMRRYLHRSNNIPMSVLGRLSPNQMHSKLAATEFI